MTEFVAIDGEAIDDTYSLLASSLGKSVFRLEDGGLKTPECFEFLLSHRAKGRVLVCFGLNYDVNNWLRNVKRANLIELWENHLTTWNWYRIEWLPGRWFSIRDNVDGRYVKVSEVFGFFQTSFVRALEDWSIPVPAQMEAMKRKRGSFTQSDRQKVERYNHAECMALVELMNRLASACSEAGITPRSWIGAGAIASSLLTAKGVAPHHAYDLDLTTDQIADEVVLGAYFGGRVELLSPGVFDRVCSCDLRSAYPHAATYLPSLDKARLRHRRRYDAGLDHAIWRVKWDIGEGLVMPFPTRVECSIYYPMRGEGWYHACEVQAAALLFGSAIEVLEGWELVTKNGELPFSFVPDLYAVRARWQRAGNPAQKPLKLGLNSLYGKLAQGYGHNRRPRWQSYFWAGEITARTRASMLRAAISATKPIMIATDGIYAQKFGSLRRGTSLGDFEHKRLDRLFAAQPGVYYARDAEGREFSKSRGFFARDIDYGELARVWKDEGVEGVYRYTPKSARFIGLGSALARGKMNLWCTWETSDRTINLAPERKLVSENGTLLPPREFMTSEPYEPKVSLLEAREIENMQGMEQPLREEI